MPARLHVGFWTPPPFPPGVQSCVRGLTVAVEGTVVVEIAMMAKRAAVEAAAVVAGATEVEGATVVEGRLWRKG